jgi:pyruvate formate lyase activating enzyme
MYLETMTKTIAVPIEKDGDINQGQIFSIQRYSIQDGPGIRTTVFFKGCPLRCVWCSNPESQNPYPEVMARSQKCEGCGECTKACPRDAIRLIGNVAWIDRSICDRCMDCVEACPSGALEVTGKVITIEEAVHECYQDEPFYRNSNGGVTLSGGEPLYQPEFALQLLRKCKEKSLNTVLDTCGYASWDIFKAILPYIDLILFDVKHLDSEMHRQGTGVGNEVILDNLKKLIDSRQVKMWIRIPLIPGYNDSEEHVKEVARKVAKGPVEKVSVLSYHEWGKPKYGFLGREYAFENRILEDRHKLEDIKNIIASEGLSVTIGH